MFKKFFSFLFFFTAIVSFGQRPVLWYDHPANSSIADSKNPWESDSVWLQALPVGNGFIGAMVFGDVNKERIQLNEKSLWSGSPDDNNNPAAAAALPEIRKLLFAGKYREADSLINKTQVCKGAGSSGGAYGSYQTLGNLLFDFKTQKPYSAYRKELDLEQGIVKVNYTQDGIKYERKVFADYPDKALIIHMSADKKHAVSFTVSLTRPERSVTLTDQKQLIMTGHLDNGKGGDGMKYTARLKAIANGGKVIYKDSTLTVTDANDVTLILVASTNYRQHYPDYVGTDPDITTAEQLKELEPLSFVQLLKNHLKDYQSLFKKVSLKLSENTPDTIPTDRLLTHAGNLHLQELYFQFGRYVLISSSRNGTLPANLQGIWANKIRSAWNCDYHTNINLQMNYWPADESNLSDCFNPFTDFVASIVAPGEKTASVQYGAHGWSLGPISNVWGYTSPGEGTGWGMYVTGSGWLCQQLWDHYTYTLDADYLKKIYPILLKSASFYIDWLVKDPFTGKLVSGPATSPENTFIKPDGKVGAMSMGPAHDQEIIYGLFSSILKASVILKDGAPLITKIKSALNNLALPQISADGRIMEWAKDFKEVEIHHRHVSHLYMLYPGTQIDPYKTPLQASAAKKTLEVRGDEGTGWSLAWKINFWARLYDGNHAYLLLKNLLRPTSSYKVQMSDEGGTYPNLFCGHPPFQIDGNFGGAAGIAEMLLQSHSDEIYLLPAVPNEWNQGSVYGLKARGNFEIAMQWNNHALLSATVKSLTGGTCIVRTGVKILVANTKFESTKTKDGFLTVFKTQSGKIYSLSKAE